MRKLIILALISLNLIALEFGKDVSIIGKWEITSKDNQFIELFVTIGNKWNNVEFKENGYIYRDKNDKKKPTQTIWRYKEDGTIHTKFYMGDKKPSEAFVTPEFNPFSSDSYIKLIQRVNDELNECYIVEVINQKHQITMCRILTEQEKYRKAQERAKRVIKIEMR